MIFKIVFGPGQCGSVAWSIVPYTERLWVCFSVRARAQVAGSSLVGVCIEGNRSMLFSHINVPLSSFLLSLSLPLPLSLKSIYLSLSLSLYIYIIIIFLIKKLFLETQFIARELCTNLDQRESSGFLKRTSKGGADLKYSTHWHQINCQSSPEQMAFPLTSSE